MGLFVVEALHRASEFSASHSVMRRDDRVVVCHTFCEVMATKVAVALNHMIETEANEGQDKSNLKGL